MKFLQGRWCGVGLLVAKDILDQCTHIYIYVDQDDNSYLVPDGEQEDCLPQFTL